MHDIEVQERAKLRVELEPGLVSPVIGLIAAPDIGGEFGPADNFVDDGGHVMLPDPGAQKRQIVLAGFVLLQLAKKIPAQLDFRCEGGRQVKRGRPEMVLRDLLEHLVHGGRADFRQHRFQNSRRGVRHPRMRPSFACHSVCSLSNPMFRKI